MQKITGKLQYRMKWTKDFYSKTGKWWGPAEVDITERDHIRFQTIKRLVPSARNILELGSSYGNTAAVCASEGMNVTGIEISDRIDFADKYKGQHPNNLTFLKEDFYQIKLENKFDAVIYWNGFGIGTDSDQRKLLGRISDEWLLPDGKALIDIANPYVWTRWTGDEEHKDPKPELGYNYSVNQKIDFDPVHNRFIDMWWDSNNLEEVLKQDIRCYSPADLLLLLEKTNLTLEKMEIEGKEFKLDEPLSNSSHPLAKANEYLAVLSIKK